MREKINIDRCEPWAQGYFKPKGKWAKRQIHKLARRMKDLDINRKGIYNRIGIWMEWS